MIVIYPEESAEMVQPWWPLAVLAVIQLGDAAMCVKPVAFIRQCLTDVRFPERFWKLLPPLKVAAAAGLVAGIWVPPLAVLTCSALVCYFVVAVAAHLRARDFGRNLFLNATTMLIICVAVLVFTVQALPSSTPPSASTTTTPSHAFAPVRTLPPHRVSQQVSEVGDLRMHYREAASRLGSECN